MSISGEHPLQGRRAVVTGGSRGIGAATAALLARRGAAVHLVARGEDDLRRVAAEIESDSGRPATATVADVSTAEGCDRVARDVAGIGVDILVNNAGGTGILPVLQASDGEIESILSLNLLSVMRLCRDLVPLMQGWGRVVNVCSVAAREPHRNTAHYAAAKAAVVAYTKALSGEVGRRGVNVNAVLPGYTLTPQTSERTEELRRTTGLSTAVMIERMIGRDQALGRPGTAHEVAEAIAFLASDAAGLITGVALPVDGGTLHGVW